jgi:hypothetical protein
MRYWDGAQWIGDAVPPPPQQSAQQEPQVTYTKLVTGRGYQRGGSLTFAQHLLHAILTLCTFGLWAPVWFLMWWLGRRRIADSDL